MTRASRARLVVLLLAVAAACLLYEVHPVLALGPVVVPGLPAALLLWHGRGGRDPYNLLDEPPTPGG